MRWADPVDLFFARAEAEPAHSAVVESGRTVSYGELAALARRIGHAVRAHGENPRVLIHLPHGADAYAAMFGVLLSGGTYAPTNVSAPRTRQHMVLQSFDPDVVVTSDPWSAALGLSPSDRHIVDIAWLPDDRLRVPEAGADVAYVMFTSGSTGVPKGVMISREGLAHYTAWALDAMAAAPGDRWSQHPNIGFDLSVLDIYGALCGGATLYPLQDRRDRLLPGAAIRRHHLTIWNSVPSAVDLIVRGGHLTADHLASLRLMTFCGEPLLESHLDAIFAARPDIVVHNTYGPTEATVSMTLIRLTAGNYRDACNGSAALGEPIPFMRLWLAGGDDEDEGEIIIGGPQVARGYWRDPAETSAAFGHKLLDGVDVPSYRTGDWAARRGGHLYFQNRVDRQVKIHGHRIELGEIDAALRASGAAGACTVLWRDTLHSFVEAEGSLDPALLSRNVAERVPHYALPEIHRIDRLPRNANDKIDARALTSLLESSEEEPVQTAVARGEAH